VNGSILRRPKPMCHPAAAGLTSVSDVREHERSKQISLGPHISDMENLTIQDCSTRD